MAENTQKNSDMDGPQSDHFAKEKHKKKQVIANLDYFNLKAPSVSEKQNLIQIMKMESKPLRFDRPSIEQQCSLSEESMVSESLPDYESDFQQQASISHEVVDQKQFNVQNQQFRSKAFFSVFKQDYGYVNPPEAAISQQKQELFQDQMENEADDQSFEMELSSDSDSFENYSESPMTNIAEEEQYYSSQMSDQNSSPYSSSNYRR